MTDKKVDQTRDMLLVYISKGGVSITVLTEEGRGTLDDKKYQSLPGQWEDWSKYMDKEEAMQQVAEFINV